MDLVVLYDEDTPEETLEVIRPDLLIEGADRTEDVVGADMVQGWGGKVYLAEILPGFSRTSPLRSAATQTAT